MDLYAVKLSCGIVAAMIDNLTVTNVHGSYGLHLLCCQRKVKNTYVLPHPFRMDGFWNRCHSPLIMPAQNDLGRGLVMLPAIRVSVL